MNNSLHIIIDSGSLNKKPIANLLVAKIDMSGFIPLSMNAHHGAVLERHSRIVPASF